MRSLILAIAVAALFCVAPAVSEAAEAPTKTNVVKVSHPFHGHLHHGVGHHWNHFRHHHVWHHGHHWGHHWQQFRHHRGWHGVKRHHHGHHWGHHRGCHHGHCFR